MNFCSVCGSNQLIAEIPDGDHRLRNVCKNCGTIHYSNPLIVTGCLVTFNGKILLAKRGIEPRKGYWNLPAGFMENSETAEEGALREVKEETGLSVIIERLHTVFSVVHANQVYLIFKANAVDADFTLTPESTAIEFFSPDKIPWDEIAFSSNKHALRTYLDFPDNQTVHLSSYLKNK